MTLICKKCDDIAIFPKHDREDAKALVLVIRSYNIDLISYGWVLYELMPIGMMSQGSSPI